MATLGMIGGGQLGRMTAIDAAAHGHRVIVRTDEQPNGPAAQVSVLEVNAPYDDREANRKFAEQCDAITSEFENLPTDLLAEFAEHAPVRPSASALHVCQHRGREKEFLRENGFPHAPYKVVRSSDDLGLAVATFDQNVIVKTAAFGYDGKGQIRIRPGVTPNTDAAWVSLQSPAAVVESFVAFQCEISVVGVRSMSGEWVPFPPGENIHVNGMLDHTVAPARVSRRTADEAQWLAGQIAVALDYVGVLGVEFFVLADGSLLVNELAPRPHNSAHHTIEACVTSQFGQHWRAALGHPLGDPTQREGVVMCNLLGDLWLNGEPNWADINRDPRATLHLYGKSEARAGRKMGHLTVLTDDVPEALSLRESIVQRG
jgi:5-(carboxyamino)imidazole ribonucleotide synthase